MRLSTVRHAAGLACIWYAYSAYAEMRDSGGDMTQEWLVKVVAIALGGVYFGFGPELSSGTFLANLKKQATAVWAALQQTAPDNTPVQQAEPLPPSPQIVTNSGLTAADIQAVFAPPPSQSINMPSGCDSESAQLVRHVDKLIEIANGDEKLADQVMAAQDALLRKLHASKK